MGTQGHAAQRGPTPEREEPSAITADGEGRVRGTSPIPTHVGRYVILMPLGEGGMGVVLEAFDPELDRRVAIKLLHPLRGGANASRRLLREAQVMARLSHPNVVQIHDAGEIGASVFLAMELVRGQTMRAWLRSAQRPWREVLRHFIEAGRGLAAAHDAGIVHRDFKPDNMLIGEDGRVRVADFGLANVGGRGASQESTDSALDLTPRKKGLMPFTATGAVMGTPMYMAPEQHVGVDVGPAADQFGFCVALHEALFGQRPFPGQSTHEIAASVLDGRYIAPTRVDADRRWLIGVLRRGLAVDPGARFPSFHALVAALERDPSLRRRRWLGAIVAAGVTAVTSTVVLGGDASEPCHGGPAQYEQVWGEQAHADIAGVVGGDAADADRLATALDRYGVRWSAAHRSVCLAHQGGELSTELLDRSMACLDRRKAAVAQLVDVVRDRGASALALAPTAALRLPDAVGCTDRGAVDLVAAPPTDPEVARTVEGLRLRLAQTAVIHDGGEIERAVAALAAIARDAGTIGYAPLVAETALVRGRLAMERMDRTEARSALADAAAFAIEAGLDPLAAEAMVRKMFVDAATSSDPTQVLADERMVNAVVQRAGAPARLVALLANNLGFVHGLVGNRTRAMAAFERAMAVGDTDDANPLDVAGYAVNLALLTADPAPRDALFERAGGLVLDAVGPNHPMNLEIAARRAEHTVPVADALVRTAAVCQSFATRLPAEFGQRHDCQWRLAELHDERGEIGPAIVAVDGALRALGESLDAADAEYMAAQTAKTAGYLAVLRGEHAEALVELDLAADRFAPHAALPWIAIELADVAWLRARSLTALGRDAEARVQLGVAIAAYETRRRVSEDRAVQARLDRARRAMGTGA